MRELEPPPGGGEVSGYTDAEWISLGHHLQPFNISLAGVKDNELQVAGSGVCVTVDGFPCVLTAYHVLYGGEGKRGVLDYPSVSFLTSRWDIQRTYPRELFSEVRIAGPPFGENGPDLAALILPDCLRSDFEAHAKSFYNLDRHKAELKDITLGDAKIGWVFAGVPKERWRFENEGIAMLHLFGECSNPTRLFVNRFEFLDIRASCKPPCDPPRSFEGMSGGGLWAMRREEDAEDWTATLMGIAFYQLSPAETYCYVRCHGPADIYGRSYGAILEKFMGKSR